MAMRTLVLTILVLWSGSIYAASLEDDTDYGQMLEDELGIIHFRARMHYDSPVYLAAHFTKTIEGKTVHAYTVSLKEPGTVLGLYFLYRTSPLEPKTGR
jgi:hypothetical protein